jgi:prepilin-type N-terminal cleavage/methylation domain-containing protein/prepilin-type processing-associated H-X9-DG protein
MGRRPSLRPAGFTLIEVLVVVAIIALLVSILLPSLSRAKEQARAVSCGSKLSQIGRAESTYASEQKDWILGSPWSTGYPAMTSTVNSNDWNTFSQQDRLIVDWYDTSTPIRALIQGSKSIPHDRNQMLIQCTQGLFQCDSNPHTSVPFPIGTPTPTIQAISYLSMWSLMRAGPSGYNRAQTMPFTSAGGSAGWVAQLASWEMSLPSDYFPRHAKLGRESMKVFMADGFRFLVENNAGTGDGYADYDASGFRNSKGIGNVDEPPSSSGSDYNKMYNVARKYAYRHGSKDAINAVFFDGHVSLLRVNYARAAGNTDPGSGFSGDAVQPKYYYPSGTVVNQAGYLHLPIAVGTKLP